MDIKQNTVLGQAESVLVENHMVKTYEYDEEQDNNVAIKRLDLRNSVKTELTPSATLDQCDILKIPEHLTDLFERSCEKLSPKENADLARILVQYQDTFFRNDWNLGLTHLTEHT